MSDRPEQNESKEGFFDKKVPITWLTVLLMIAITSNVGWIIYTNVRINRNISAVRFNHSMLESERTYRQRMEYKALIREKEIDAQLEQHSKVLKLMLDGWHREAADELGAQNE